MRFLLPLILLSLPLLANQADHGYCENGAVIVNTNSISSTTQVQGSYPSCTVAVYLTGTLVLATIYSDNSNTVLANPFTASTNGSWYYYAANGTYDVAFSGGGIPTPFTSGGHTLFDFSAVSSFPASQISGILPCANLPVFTGAITTSGGSCTTSFGSVSLLPVTDSTAIVFSNSDPTKLIKLSATNLTTGTTVTLSAQNSSYTLAGLEPAQTFTGLENFNGGSPLLGSAYFLYGAVAKTGPFNSEANDAAHFGFVLTNNNFLVDGTGNISANGSLNMLGNTSLGAYRVNGVVVVDNAQNGIFNTVISNGAFNSLATGASIAFLTHNNNFLVDGSGDISMEGVLNIVGTYTTGTCLGAICLNSSTVLDGAGNATVNNLTVNGSCTGCGGGGGGGLPVADTSIIVFNSVDNTKKAKLDATGVPTGTTINLVVPANTGAPSTSLTIATLESTQSITGLKVFTQLLSAPTFQSSAGTSASLPAPIAFNSNNLTIDGNGNLSAACTGTGVTCGINGTGGNLLASGLVTTGVALGMKPSGGSCPTGTPGSSYGAWAYKGGTDGLVFCVYTATAGSPAWTPIDLGAIAGTGITSINGRTNAVQVLAGTANQITITPSGTDTNTFSLPSTVNLTNLTVSGTCTGCGSGGGGVTSLLGTANEVFVSAPTGTVTLSLPQPIALTSTPSFNGVIASGSTPTFNSTATGGTIGFNLTNNNFLVNGNGDVTINGSLNSSAGTSLGAFRVSGTVVIDASRNLTNIGSISATGGISTSGGTIQSLVSGASVAFQAGSGTLQILGNGNISGQVFNATSYQVGATTVIDGSRNLTNIGTISSGQITTTGSTAVIAGGNIQAGLVFAVAGGFFGSTQTIVIGSCSIFVKGGIIYGTSGC